MNPTTVDELWWPGDLTALQIRPALNVLFRNGNLSYVSAGLDVRVPHASRSWRNYGLNSQPIARMWTTLDIAMESIFHVETFVLENDTHAAVLRRAGVDVEGILASRDAATAAAASQRAPPRHVGLQLAAPGADAAVAAARHRGPVPRRVRDHGPSHRHRSTEVQPRRH